MFQPVVTKPIRKPPPPLNSPVFLFVSGTELSDKTVGFSSRLNVIMYPSNTQRNKFDILPYPNWLTITPHPLNTFI